MRKMSRRVIVTTLVAVLVLGMLLIPAIPVGAYPSVDWAPGGVQVSISGSSSPQFVADGLGGVFAYWYEKSVEKSMLTRLLYDGNAAPGWGSGVVAPPADRMIKDGSGGVWLARIPDPKDKLYIYHFLPDGTEDPEFAGGKVVLEAEINILYDSGFIEDEYGGIYYAWSDYNGDICEKLFCVRFDRNWNVSPGWPEKGKLVATDSDVGQSISGVVPDEVGGVMVVWNRYIDITPGEEKRSNYIQRLDSDGGIHTGWLEEGKTLAFMGGSPRLTSDGEGGVLATWTGCNYEGGIPGGFYEPPDRYELHAARLDVDGNKAWAVRLGTITGLDYYRITADGYGGAFCNWYDCSIFPYYDNKEHRLIHLGPKGEPLQGWAEGGVNTGCEMDVASDLEGGAYLFFRNIDDGMVRWKRIDSDGSTHPGWPDDGAVIEATPYNWELVQTGERSFVVSWTGVNEPYYLYAQKVTDVIDPPNFDTYILLENPGDQPAEVFLTFMLEGGVTKRIPRVIPPHSRYTVKVNDQAPYRSVSTKVESSVPIVCERSMYFDYLSTYQGGHDCTGVTAPGTTWYLAEGYTANRFDTYLLLQNPGEDTAQVTVTYMLPGSETVEGNYTVPPHSRYTVSVDAVPGLESTELSMKIDSSEPICAERAMYFNYYGRIGGHDQAAVPSPQETWYLPEGYTAEEFDTYVLVQNPGDTEATVTYTFMKDDGENVPVTRTVGPHSRFTVKVDDIEGLSGAMFSTRVSSDVPVIAERAMYFDYEGKAGGHDSVGATSPSPTWYLAEGYTAGEFDTYVLMQNTGDATANVEATYMLPWGDPVVETYEIAPNSRYTVKVDDIPGLEATEVSTKLETTNGTEIIAERAIYFTYADKWSGGHDAIGVTQPSATWYFAEGYTGY